MASIQFDSMLLEGIWRSLLMANVLLRLPAVKARTGLSRSTIYLRVSEGKFPEPISLGARAVGWLDSEIDAWLAAQIEQSRRTRKERPRLREVESEAEKSNRLRKASGQLDEPSR
jgi:prophage regulatory protein